MCIINTNIILVLMQITLQNIFTASLLFSQVFCENGLYSRFDEWVREFRVKFHSGNDYESTFLKWVSNHKYIEYVNSMNLSYTLGHNAYSGMNLTEFKGKMTTTFDYEQHNANRYQFPSYSTLPTSVNWVDVGAVTQVKDQGQCGSCWSFSTTGALEGVFYNKFGKLVSFSEQQLVDCDTLRNGGHDHGCNGGLMDNAFQWIHTNGGLCEESSYVYVSGKTQKSGSCVTTCELVDGSIVAKYVDVPPHSDYEMMSAITFQPVSIAIEADTREFQLYKSGVFDAECGTNLDHGVLVVGYGTLDGKDYYLIKNSWGSSWGQNGYILLGRGYSYNNGDGQCGMLLQGSYPVL